MSRTRRLVAIVVGALVALAPGLVGACFAVFGSGFVNADGTPDNPPIRGAALFLLASPLLLACLLGYYAVAIEFLSRLVRLSFGWLLSASVAAALALWVWLLVREGNPSWEDIVNTGILSAVVAILLAGGSLASWLVLRSGHNTPLHPTAGLRLLREGAVASPRRG